MGKLLSPLRPGALALAGSCLAFAAHAQTADKKTAIGVNISMMQYQGDLGSDWGHSSFPLQVGVGAHITRYLSPSFDVAVLGNYQNYYRFVSPNRPYNSFTARTGMVDLGLKLKLNNGKILKEDFFLQPYLMGGGGFFMANSSGNYATSAANQPIAGSFFNQVRRFEVFGLAGMKFRLSPAVGLDITASQHYPFAEGIDNINNPNKKLHDRFLVYSAGLTVALGQAKDADGDGVPDRKDKCPDTPAGVKVDVNGCPLDTDGDGVPDYQDKCPDVKGLASLQGCPDADGDGVADADDKCPNTPAGVRVDASGCPVDSDGDGVADYLDKCPNTPAGVKVDANGCPLDRDGDGVPDYQDRCPDRPGPASNKGCPEIKAEQKKILNEATKYIQFDFNKATLKPSSNARLEQMVAIMNEYPDYSLSIAGHTDNVGNDDYNLRLSYERAAAARKYMLSKGIPAERIEARGYGKTKPIADNKTKAGQALNRRVDFDPFLTGETNAAEAKYGPAPTISELKAEGKKLPGKKTTGTGAPRSRKAPAKRK
ncbi:MAG TPA: OmpA family protein [Hymenobacter sp.]|uniref:OmpA family protein n=1 Tax=Hymenobacter sp. TaxID=1898978 RepID=UPI002D800A20|nr:OmpA family protein [Hymenobacter sp.]HET9504671.1 OmpA family protein [Hymenobacter sp.]